MNDRRIAARQAEPTRSTGAGQKVFVAAPTAEGIARMFEALTGEKASPAQIADLEAELKAASSRSEVKHA